jgi:hypothetical protein
MDALEKSFKLNLDRTFCTHAYGFQHIFLACSWEFGSFCLPLSKDIKNLSALEFVILACKITVQSFKSSFITRQLLHCK